MRYNFENLFNYDVMLQFICLGEKLYKLRWKLNLQLCVEREIVSSIHIMLTMNGLLGVIL